MPAFIIKQRIEFHIENTATQGLLLECRRDIASEFRLSVRPSVRLLNACFVTKRTCAHILIPRERSFILVRKQEE